MSGITPPPTRLVIVGAVLLFVTAPVWGPIIVVKWIVGKIKKAKRGEGEK